MVIKIKVTLLCTLGTPQSGQVTEPLSPSRAPACGGLLTGSHQHHSLPLGCTWKLKVSNFKNDEKLGKNSLDR